MVLYANKMWVNIAAESNFVTDWVSCQSRGILRSDAGQHYYFRHLFIPLIFPELLHVTSRWPVNFWELLSILQAGCPAWHPTIKYFQLKRRTTQTSIKYRSGMLTWYCVVLYSIIIYFTYSTCTCVLKWGMFVECSMHEQKQGDTDRWPGNRFIGGRRSGSRLRCPSLHQVPHQVSAMAGSTAKDLRDCWLVGLK